MANLFDSLHTAGSALGVYQEALGVVQNNITNSATPGYARQSLNLESRPFDIAGGLAGGVAARGLASARNEYAEDEVRRQAQSLGFFDAEAESIQSIEGLFDVSGTGGVPGALNQLFQSFSAWSVTPGDVSARQTVLANAGNLAAQIRKLAGSLSQASTRAESQIGSTVSQINQLAATIQQFNAKRLQHQDVDPGEDANLHAALEQLANLADVTTLTQADGTVTVLLSGGAPLVVGTSQYALSSSPATPSGAVNPQGPPSSRILDWQGNDITPQLTGGRLGGLIDFRNRVMAGILGDGNQAGSLNVFAKNLADKVNQVLTSGTTAPGAGGAAGSPLFSYDAADATRAASTFALDAGITTAKLAPVDASGNANGNAILLASLANSTSAGGIGGATFGEFFGEVTASVGRESASAQQNQQTQAQVVATARGLRDHLSGVSLDEEAVVLLQYQRSYQAAARVLTTLNDILGETVNLIR